MKWDISNFREWGWKEHEPGATIAEAGNSKYFSTGNWRLMRPVKNEESCSDCLLCYMFCPDSSIVIKEGRMKGFDLDHCKGCGICANECAKSAIEMVPEIGLEEGDE